MKKNLMKAFKAEVVNSPTLEPQEGDDPTAYFPPPRGIFQTMRILDSKKRLGWIRATRKE